jgi:hypothetical protein
MRLLVCGGRDFNDRAFLMNRQRGFAALMLMLLVLLLLAIPMM